MALVDLSFHIVLGHFLGMIAAFGASLLLGLLITINLGYRDKFRTENSCYDLSLRALCKDRREAWLVVLKMAQISEIFASK